MTTRLTIVAILGILSDYSEGHSSEEETLEAIRHQLAEPAAPPVLEAEPARKPVKKSPKRKGGWSDAARERVARMNAAKAAKKAAREAEKQGGASLSEADPPEVIELARDMWRTSYPNTDPSEENAYWLTCLEQARKELV